MNTSGVLKANVYDDFDPQMSLQL